MWRVRGDNTADTLELCLQARVDLRDVVVVGVVPPVAAGLGDRGRDVELCHFSGLLEDVDVHALRSVPCDVAVESWDEMLVILLSEGGSID